MTQLKITFLCTLVIITIWAVVELVQEMDKPIPTIEPKEKNHRLEIIWFAVCIGWIIFATLY
jgi:hypothetical protein